MILSLLTPALDIFVTVVYIHLKLWEGLAVQCVKSLPVFNRLVSSFYSRTAGQLLPKYNQYLQALDYGQSIGDN